MPIPTQAERVGMLVADRYELEEVLGSGGMGVVYGGTHTWTGRRVALKVLKPDVASDVTGVRRFLQEARSAATISHPNVIDVLDMGTDEDGTVFMVLERLDGHTLGERIEEEGRLGVAETLEVMLPVLEGLASAHELGILHRDLKPDNIFVAVDGAGRTVPKILDFGMSKVLESQFANNTDSGTMLGTPSYMAPEQADGDPDIGPPADVWAAGAVLYHCLTGVKPFVAASAPALLLKIIRGQYPPIREVVPQVPRRLAEVVERALTIDRSVRWSDVTRFGAELRRAAVDAGVALKTQAFAHADAPFPVASTRRPRRGWLAAGALLGAAALGGLAWGAAGLVEEAAPEAADVAAAAPGPEASPPEATPPEPAADDGPASGATPEATTAVEEAPEPPPTRVRVVSDPPGATVSADGAPPCTTPCEVETTRARRITVGAPGRLERAVELDEGREGELSVTLERRPRRRPRPARSGRRRARPIGEATGRAPSEPSAPPVPALPEDPF